MGDLNQKLLQGFVDSPPITTEEAAEIVRIAESVANWNQVSKALCGKENATLEEVLQAVSQVKAELETVKRERDALMPFVEGRCEACAFLDDCSKHDGDPNGQYVRWYEDCEDWEWRGVFPENTEVQKDD